MAKVERMAVNNETEVLYVFDCPACGVSHGARVAASKERLPLWDFNGDLNRPTFYPSIGTEWHRENGEHVVCHSHVEDGRIRYLSDCTHAMAGKSVELPELESTN